MSDRPELSTNIGSATFLEYYYLKEELVAFCRENGLPVSGGKIELTERIAHFLDTGVIVNNSSKRLQRKVSADFVITPSSIIEDNIVCSEKHRAFFKKEIGEAFSFTGASSGNQAALSFSTDACPMEASSKYPANVTSNNPSLPAEEPPA